MDLLPDTFGMDDSLFFEQLRKQKEDFQKDYPYVISIYHITPASSGVSCFNNFRIRSNNDIDTIKKRFLSSHQNFKLTYFDGTTNVCLHIDMEPLNNSNNCFIFRNIQIEGQGVIFGMDNEGSILKMPSEIPLSPFNNRTKLQGINVVEIKYVTPYRRSRSNWFSVNGDDEIRRMDKETDGSWRIENDFD